jgi:hypothetical protein
MQLGMLAPTIPEDRMLRTCSATLIAIAAATTAETTPYLEPSPGSTATFSEIISVGETGAAGEAFCGIPDGLGAYDNGDGSFTLLVNHELGTTAGKVRAHGNKGGFVSKLVISKTTLAVQSVSDFNATNTSINLWNGTGWTAGTTAYARLCSADLPAATAFHNATSGKGTQSRIFMSGEETGAEGRAFAHIATGAAAGTSWQLPHMGRCSWENLLACPKAQDATVVIGLDDSSPGQLYVYVGAKRSTGNDIEKAGLVGGRLYGVRANASASEVEDITVGGSLTTLGGIAKGGSASFSLVDLGDASGLTGAQVQANSTAGGVTEFLRPEDGAWDPSNPSDFYFVTTHRFDQTKNGSGAQTGATRLWRLRFHDIANPAAGGAITLLLDGDETGTQMFDNLCFDAYGRILIQEDPGNQAHAARIWSYEVGSGTLTEIAKHDDAIFGDYAGGVGSGTILAGFTQDEESSGIIDVSAILGAGTYLLAVQAHGTTKYSDGTDIPGIADVVEGGQLLKMTLAPVADTSAPGLRNWGFGARRGTATLLTGRALAATDDRAAASGVTYTVTTAPTKGQLRKNGAAATTFTQADLDANRVAYVHTAGSGDAFDRFTFSVSDGTNSLAGQVLNISIGEGLRVQKVGEYAIPSGYNSNGGVAEIVAHDPTSQRLFVVNGQTGAVDVLALADDASTSLVQSLVPADEAADATNVTSVAVKNGIVAAAVGHTDAQSPGFIFFYAAGTGAYLHHIDLGSELSQTGAVRGALPDMITFTPDGGKVLVAIEGEPADDYSVDPHGGIVVVDISLGVANPTTTWCGFDGFDASTLRSSGVRIFNDKATGTPTLSAAADLEPEYIAVSADGTTAWATCQENNAVAVIGLAIPSVTAVVPLGSKNWADLTLDASDEDSGTDTNSGGTLVKLASYPVRGLYMPDAIAALSADGATWLLTANEGDARAYTALNEEARLRSAPRDAAWDAANPGKSFDSNLGRLNLTRYSGDTDNDGDLDVMHAYGARSFSVWSSAGVLAWDSGNAMETFFSTYFTANFNANHTSNSLDSRSDDKGPEPEGIVTVSAGGRSYAAVGLERMGGFFLYDLSTPTAPTMAAYYTGRRFEQTPGNGSGGDLGPEGMLAIAAADSPTGKALVVVGNEVSGTVAIHEVVPAAGDTASGSGSAVATAAGSSGGSSSTPAPADDDGSGCNAGGGLAGLLVAMLGLVGLRRRR